MMTKLHMGKIHRPAIIRRVKEEFGRLGNMSRDPVLHEGVWWGSTEALFQALRFDANTSPWPQVIRGQKSPMDAKRVAKAHVEDMVVAPCSPKDLENMRLCLRLKYETHKDLRILLASSRARIIVEDCTRRQEGSGLFWGAALRDGEWVGNNWLGRLWMEIRDG